MSIETNNYQQLILDNQKLVYFIINTYYPTYSHNEDIIQEGFVGLCLAAKNWDSDKATFSSFASKCILNEIKRYFKRTIKHEKIISLDNKIQTDDENMTLMDVIEGEADVPIDSFNYDCFYKQLKPIYQKILDLSIDHTNTEISEILGLTEHSVKTYKWKIRRKWRNFNE